MPIFEIDRPLSIEPGFYRGRIIGSTLEIIGASRTGATLRTEIDCHMNETYVIIQAAMDRLTLHLNSSDSNIRNAKLDDNTAPITPEYLKELAVVRAANAGPAIAQLNAILINNAMDLSTGETVHIPYSDFMNCVDMQYLEIVISAFAGKGFYILHVADGVDGESMRHNHMDGISVKIN